MPGAASRGPLRVDEAPTRPPAPPRAVGEGAGGGACAAAAGEGAYVFMAGGGALSVGTGADTGAVDDWLERVASD